MRRSHAIALVAFFALAGAASADKIEMHINISKADFASIKSHLIEQLDSDRYAEITPDDKAAVVGALDRIGQRLAKPLRGDQDLVDIFNDQELINQITSHAKAESRIYCERSQPTGSHIIKVTCMSMAKWMQREQAGQSALQAMTNNHKNHCPGCMYDAAQDPLPGIGR